MAAITRWSTGSAVCSAVLRSPPLPSEPLLALRSANQLHEISALLTAAVMHLALARRSGSKLGGEGETHDWDYMVYPVFAPFFNFSYRRKRKMTLTPDQVLALVDSPSQAIRQILAASNRSPDEPLPEQLRLFEMFYAESN